jgi:hypothetical protein
MKEAPGSSETTVLTRATRRNNPEDTILHSHRRENLKSYVPNILLFTVNTDPLLVWAHAAGDVLSYVAHATTAASSSVQVRDNLQLTFGLSASLGVNKLLSARKRS